MEAAGALPGAVGGAAAAESDTAKVDSDVASFRAAFKEMGSQVREAQLLHDKAGSSVNEMGSTRFEAQQSAEEMAAKLCAHADAIREITASIGVAQTMLKQDSGAGAGSASSATLRDALEDVGEELALGTAALGRLHSEGVELPYLEQKKTLQLGFAAMGTAAIELFNEVGDILFLTELWAMGTVGQGRDGSTDGGDTSSLALGLFYASVASLTVNTLGRIGVILKTRGSGWRNVKDELKGDFLLGAAMFMIVAPSIGMARMKSTLEDKNTGGTAIGRGAITSAGVAKRDAVASEALSAYIAGQAEVRTAVILIATQDVFELSVQLLFALLVSKQADLSALFWISTLGTVLHMLQHGVEAWLTWRTLPKLRMKGEGRDHVFDASVDASTLGKAVNEFAVKHGRHVRKVVLRDCKELDDTGKPNAEFWPRQHSPLGAGQDKRVCSQASKRLPSTARECNGLCCMAAQG